nr:MAG: hypothetical protein [Chemarfal virus 74]
MREPSRQQIDSLHDKATLVVEIIVGIIEALVVIIGAIMLAVMKIKKLINGNGQEVAMALKTLSDSSANTGVSKSAIEGVSPTVDLHSESSVMNKSVGSVGTDEQLR